MSGYHGYIFTNIISQSQFYISQSTRPSLTSTSCTCWLLTKARTEEQLRRERHGEERDHVWLVHSDGISSAVTLSSSPPAERHCSSDAGSSSVIKLSSGETLLVDNADVQKVRAARVFSWYCEQKNVLSLYYGQNCMSGFQF